MITGIFRISFALLAFLGALKLYHSVYRHPEKKGDKYLKSFFYFLVFLTLFQVALFVPAFFSPNNSKIMFYFYELAVICYFVSIFFALKTAFLFLNGGTKKELIAGIGVLFSGIFVLVTDLLFPFTPNIQDDFVIWHDIGFPNLIAGLNGLIAGLTWAFIFLKYGQNARLSGVDSLKKMLIILGSIIWGIACVVFFLASTPSGFFVANLLTAIGVLCILIILVLPGQSKSYEHDYEANIYR